MNTEAQYWINKLNLQKHPEGGYYKEIYRSDENIAVNSLPPRFNGERCFSTSIYFLLENDNFSAFHRIKSDETWHFYSGNCLIIITIDENGALNEFKLGNNPENGESFQICIPQDTWFAACLERPDTYALVGCTVAPGFDFADFELATKNNLLGQFPHHSGIIEKLCIS